MFKLLDLLGKKRIIRRGDRVFFNNFSAKACIGKCTYYRCQSLPCGVYLIFYKSYILISNYQLGRPFSFFIQVQNKT